MPLTAGAPSHVLINKLRQAGWGVLATSDLRGVTNVLETLTLMLDSRSGAGKATAWQIAEQARLSERWVRRCLNVLEELELIEWNRGGIVDGKPVPSWFRVSKRALLNLINLARDTAYEKRAEQAVAVRQRVQAYRLHRTKRGRRNRRSDHAELSSRLLSIEEVPRAERPIGAGPSASREAIADAVATMRATLRAKRGLPPKVVQESKTATTRAGANQVPADLRG